MFKISIHLSIVLVIGTIVAVNPLFIVGAQAEPYDGIHNDRKEVTISSLRCNNINVNVNGLDLDILPPALSTLLTGREVDAAAYSYGSGNENYGSETSSDTENNLRYVCINNNNNTVIEEVPTTASLTVKKQVFGCNNFSNFDISFMHCMDLQNNSTAPWFDCNNTSISNSDVCQSLPENIFDIEVLDDQNNQLQQFQGSTEGTTIHNLEPGTYRVNEIKSTTSFNNQLLENPDTKQDCVNLAGFLDGGDLFNTTSHILYFPICFEYEDEQGNDCSTITLAAGEERTCIVKNYIRQAEEQVL
jgi:hypothetical protein